MIKINNEKILITFFLIAEIIGYVLLFLVDWKLVLGIILILSARSVANTIK